MDVVEYLMATNSSAVPCTLPECPTVRNRSIHQERFFGHVRGTVSRITTNAISMTMKARGLRIATMPRITSGSSIRGMGCRARYFRGSLLCCQLRLAALRFTVTEVVTVPDRCRTTRFGLRCGILDLIIRYAPLCGIPTETPENPLDDFYFEPCCGSPHLPPSHYGHAFDAGNERLTRILDDSGVAWWSD